MLIPLHSRYNSERLKWNTQYVYLLSSSLSLYVLLLVGLPMYLATLLLRRNNAANKIDDSVRPDRFQVTKPNFHLVVTVIGSILRLLLKNWQKRNTLVRHQQRKQEVGRVRQSFSNFSLRSHRSQWHYEHDRCMSLIWLILAKCLKTNYTIARPSGPLTIDAR